MIVNPKRKKLRGLVSFKMKGKIGFLGNLERRDATKHDIEKDFPRELIEIWVDFNFRDFFLSKPDFCSSSSSSMIWNNALVRIGFFFFFFFFFFFTNTGLMLVYMISKISLTMILRSLCLFP